MSKTLLFWSLTTLLLLGCKSKTAEENAENTMKSDSTTAAEQTPTADPNEVAVIETRLGKIVLEFFPDAAPNHVANFKKLTRQGFYEGTTFHRVIPNFMIQGGCPNSKDADRSNDGMGGPGYSINAEFNKKPHLRGTLSMARTQDPNSAGSQFFICVKEVAHLDGQYTVFGQVIQGLEVVDQIVNLKRDRVDNPLESVAMKVSIVPHAQIESAGGTK